MIYNVNNIYLFIKLFFKLIYKIYYNPKKTLKIYFIFLQKNLEIRFFYPIFAGKQ